MSDQLLSTEDPATIRREISQIRERIALDLGAAGQEVQALTDWKRVVAKNPLVTLGTTALLGFWLVPRRALVQRAGTVGLMETQDVDGTNAFADPWRALLWRWGLQTAVRFAAGKVWQNMSTKTQDPQQRQEPKTAWDSTRDCS